MGNHRSIRVRAGAATAVLAVTLAGCGGDAPEGEQSERLRLGYPGGPSQGLDPHRSSQIEDRAFLAPVYDPLVIEAPDGELLPGLATGWEFNEAGDALTLTLRDGVTFHDGAELDAEAVRANLERGLTLEGSGVAPLLAPIESIEVVDPLTVTLELRAPTATMPRVLADRPGMLISPAALDDPDLASNPVGAGMFELVEYRPGDRARYARFDGYWRPDDVRVDELEVVVQSDSVTRLNALRNGELEIAGLDAPQFAEAAGDPDLSTVEYDTTGVRLLQLNRTRAEFGDVRVRQAMNHAVDRQAIVETLFLGYGTPAAQFYPESYPAGHVPELVGRYPHDPQRARDLLAAAGLADGFRFELVVPALPWTEQLAEVIQAQYAEVGIEVVLTPVELAQAANIFFVEQLGDAVLGACPCHTDPSLLAQLYFTADSFVNPGGHVLAGLPEAHAAALLPAPPAEREQRLHELMTIAVEQAGQVVLFQDRALVATRPGVTGFRWTMGGHPDVRGVGYTAP